MELLGSKTYENLKKAFITECAARTRYEFVEYGQRMAGYEGLARITDIIAYQEFNHARMLYTHIVNAQKGTIESEKVSLTLPFRQKWEMADNLILTATDEDDEARFYLRAYKTAVKEGFSEIGAVFEMIRKAELRHKKVFTYLYDKVKNKTLFNSDKEKEWLCKSCGYTVKSKVAPEKCPLCLAKRETFEVALPGYMEV